MKASPLVDTLPDNLRQAKAKINLDTQGNVRAKARVDTKADTLP